MKKPARVVALVVAIVLAILVMWTCTAPPTAPDRAGGSTTAVTGTGRWDPNPGPKRPGTIERPPETPAEPVKKPEPLPPMAETGTAVKEGQEVSIVVPWRHGEGNRFHFDVRDIQDSRDRNTGDHEASIEHWHLTLEVMDADGTGKARLRMTVDWFHHYGMQPSGLPFDVDSRFPESPFFDIPEVARRIKPMLAIVGRPLDFDVDAAGNVTDLRGIDVWHDRYVAEVRLLEKGGVAEPPDAPTRAWVTEKFSEYLFPTLGGGKLTGGATRPWIRVERQVPPWSFIWTGTIAATRDDPDAFRVDIFASPEAKQTGGTPTAASAQIAKVRAFGPNGYHAAYRFGRTPGALLEAQIDAKFQHDVSYKVGGSSGQPQYAPRFFEVIRRVDVRRTKD